MSRDIKDVIHEVSSFIRFELRKKGFVIEARPSGEGWAIQAELLDPRPDLSTSYKRVYDQNIYLIEVGADRSILSCEKIGERQKDGEIRFFPKDTHASPPSKPLPPRERPSEKNTLMDPALVGNLANEISKKVSSALRLERGTVAEEEIAAKHAFIDPHEKVDLDYNFERVGKVEQGDEGNVSDAVQRLRKLTSVSKKKIKNVS